MDSSAVIKIGIFGVAGFLLYEWMQSTGLWAQYFGGLVPTVLPPAGPTTGTTPVTTGTTPPATPAPPPIDTALASQMTQMLESGQGRSTGNVSEWNWLYTHAKNDANAPVIEYTTQYGDTGLITATQYLQERAHAGLSGIGWYRGSFIQRPLSRYVQ